MVKKKLMRYIAALLALILPAALLIAADPAPESCSYWLAVDAVVPSPGNPVGQDVRSADRFEREVVFCVGPYSTEGYAQTDALRVAGGSFASLCPAGVPRADNLFVSTSTLYGPETIRTVSVATICSDQPPLGAP